MRLLVVGSFAGVMSVACGQVTSSPDDGLEPDSTSGGASMGATGGQDAAGGSGGASGGAGGSGGASGGSGGTDPALEVDPFEGDWGDAAVLPSSDPVNGNTLLVAVNGDGNVYLAGATRSPGVLGAELPSGKTGVSFVIGLDDEGVPLFRRAFPDCGTIVEILVDADGAPWFTCTVVEYPFVTDGFYGAATLVAKLDPSSGESLREATLETEGSFIVQGLGVDSAGVAYVTGSRYDDAGGEFTVLHALDDQGDFSVVWAPSAPASGSVSAYPNDVAVLASDEPVLTGGFYPSLTAGGVTIESEAIYDGYTLYNGFIGLPEASTELQRFGGTSFDLGLAVEALAGGGFAVAGWVEGDGDVNGTAYEADDAMSSLIALFDDQAAVTQLVVLPSEGMPIDLAVGADGNVLVTGEYDDGSLLWEYDPIADEVRSRGLVSSGTFVPSGIASAPDGSVYVTGRFSGALTIDEVDFEGEAQTLLLRLPAAP